MPDTQPQSPEVGATKLGGDIAYTVVAAMPAPLFEPNLARRNVEFVVDHQNLFGGDLMKSRERGHCATRAIHESLGAGEPEGLAF